MALLGCHWMLSFDLINLLPSSFYQIFLSTSCQRLTWSIRGLCIANLQDTTIALPRWEALLFTIPSDLVDYELETQLR